MQLLALVGALVSALSLSTAAAAKRPDHTRPTVTINAPANGATVSGTTTAAATASDNVAVNHVAFRVDGAAVGSDSTAPYTYAWDTTTATNGTHQVSARATDNAGNDSADSTVTVTVNNAPPPPPPDRVRFDTTEPAGTSGLPRALSYCAAHIVRDSWDPTSHGNSPYDVARDDLDTGWSNPRFGWWANFPIWSSVRRPQIDDHYVNSDGSQMTTTEIFSMAACRWGVREDLLRAIAVQETDWHEHTGSFQAWGDHCAGHTDPNDGYGSYGMMQIKNFGCDTQEGWGGFPRSWYSTPFNVDFYGAEFRTCLEQGFWYTIPAGDDNARRERGCVGAWFSGSYNPDIAYTTSVYTHLANRDWTRYS